MLQKIEQAWSYLEDKKVARAFEIAKQLLEQGNTPEVLFLIGSCQKELKNYRFAALNIHKALKRKPDIPGAHVALADCLYQMGHLKDAYEHYSNALRVEPDSARACYGIGRIVTEPVEAVKYLRRAVKAEPQNLAFLTRLATALILAEELQEGTELLQQVLNKDPEYQQAISGLAMMYARERQYDLAVDYVMQLVRRNIYEGNAANAFLLSARATDNCDEALDYASKSLPFLPPQIKQSVYTQMALLYDYLEEYDEAWRHITAAKKISSSGKKYNAVAHAAWIDSIIDTFRPARIAGLPQVQADDSVLPIFIIGMPRSGTSLVEQILSSHPEVYGGGELSHMNDIVDGLPQTLGSGKPWPICVDDISLDELKIIRKQYLEKLPALKTPVGYVSDKMPHNFFVVGLIRMIFPEASIIHCKRNEMDTCLSLYLQDFETGHEYCNSLYDIGTHYQQYQRIMQHWNQVYPDKILELSYEDVVTEPEATLKGLFAYCGLSWHDSFLDFSNRQRAVRTASFDQVHKPLYRKSVGRWHNYQQHLDELKQGLEAGI